ncbi:MAG: acetyl-CoA carboxylase biotin carboxyl carrier protein subunit [Verrucomicrobia bacterium]|nr:acetyl-CoA carboxylase biotin carboxyl carrier protein subunit [Verrucomicrobiota bacterium]MCH8526129.1 biotin/lipoyl-binding protein [Kiritimatiellia bacterium]
MRTYKLTIEKKPYEIEVKAFNLKEATLEIDGKVMIVKVDEILSQPNSLQEPVARAEGKKAEKPKAAAASKPAPARPANAPAPAASGGTAVKAPIPGAILTMDVSEGDTVEVGQLLLKMEAMKMENQIKANHAGKVVQILVKPGDAVAQGQDLVIIE